MSWNNYKVSITIKTKLGEFKSESSGHSWNGTSEDVRSDAEKIVDLGIKALKECQE